MRIDELYEKLAARFGVEEIPNSSNGEPNHLVRPVKGYAKVRVGDYGSSVIDPSDREMSDTYSSIVAISRHFVRKPLYTIKVEAKDGTVMSVTTTDDHTCAVYDGLAVRFKAAHELKVGDTVPLKDRAEENGLEICDGIGLVMDIAVDDNTDGRWVYDMEVGSGKHVYYANGILVHNSQFMNLAPITKKYCKEAGISSDTFFEDLPKDVKDRVVKEAYSLQERINANVEQLVNKTCHTTHGGDLHYALEYIAAEGFYFAKKCYIVRKILSDDLPCNKFKYSGISVKKAEIPASMKNFLKDIYETTMTKEWSESDYRKAVEKAYSEFVKMDWNDVAYYKKVRTAKAALNELGTESVKGAGAHARACNFYNGLIKELGIAGKYPNITLGDEMRYSYVIPTNVYGQDVIAFKGDFPEEFRSIFKIDYVKMFDKIFTSSLKRYVEIMGYGTVDPTKQVEDPDFDIF